jgi:hypothetical protein
MRLHLTLIFTSLTLFSMACGPVYPTIGDMPGWFLNRDQVNGICGAGVAQFNGNVQLATNAAIQSARDELARSFETKVKGYIEQGAKDGRITSGDGEKIASQSAREQLSQGMVRKSLKYTNTRKVAVKDGQFYALVCLDAGKFQTSLKEMMKAKNNAAKEVFDQSKQMLDEQGDKLEEMMKRYND